MGGAPQGDVLVRLSWENSVNMPSALVNTSTQHSQDYTLLSFRKRKIRDFAGPLGDTPTVTLRKSCLAPAVLKVRLGVEHNVAVIAANS